MATAIEELLQEETVEFIIHNDPLSAPISTDVGDEASFQIPQEPELTVKQESPDGSHVQSVGVGSIIYTRVGTIKTEDGSEISLSEQDPLSTETCADGIHYPVVGASSFDGSPSELMSYDKSHSVNVAKLVRQGTRPIVGTISQSNDKIYSKSSPEPGPSNHVPLTLTNNNKEDEATCDTCNKICDSREGLRRHYLMEYGAKLFPYVENGKESCPLCKKLIRNIYNLQRHLKEVHKREGMCGKCGKLFHPNELRIHMLVEHNIGSVTADIVNKLNQPCAERTMNESEENNNSNGTHNFQTEKTTDPDNNLDQRPFTKMTETPFGHIDPSDEPICPVCKESSRTILSLQRHLRDRHDDDVTCGQCRHKCSSGDELRRHFLMIHKTKLCWTSRDPGNSTCPLCGKKLSNYRNVQRHLKEVHGKDGICGKCGKSFVNNEKLQIHMLFEHDLGKVDPAIMDKLNASGEERSTSDTADTDFICPKSAKKARMSCDDSHTHTKNETRRVPHGIDTELLCPVCTKETYCTIQKLQEHLRDFHNNEVTCGKCHETCASRDALRRHVLIEHITKLSMWNDNSQKATCTFCRKEISSWRGLQTHLRNIHYEGEKCGKCGKTFNSEQTVRRHMLLEHYIGPIGADIANDLDKPCIEQPRSTEHVETYVIEQILSETETDESTDDDS